MLKLHFGKKLPAILILLNEIRLQAFLNLLYKFEQEAQAYAE